MLARYSSAELSPSFVVVVIVVFSLVTLNPCLFPVCLDFAMLSRLDSN